MDADAFFVQRNPHHAHRITRPGRKQMKIAAALPVLEHFLIVTESGHLRDTPYFPFANGRRQMRGANCDWICSDKLIPLKHTEHVDFGVDLNDDRRRDGFVFLRLVVLAGVFTLWFGLIVNVVRRLRINLATRLDLLYRTELKGFHFWNYQLIAGFNRFHFAWIKSLQEMNVAVKLFGDGVGRIAVRKKF